MCCELGGCNGLRLDPELRRVQLASRHVDGAAATPADASHTGARLPLSRIRRLTVEGRRAGKATGRPDGKRLVFQSEREPGNPFYQIYSVDLTTGQTFRISPGIGKTTCGFFRPRGAQILFASTHHDPKSKQLQDEELAFRASGKERRYAWDYDPEMEIYAISEKTREIERLTNARGYDAEGQLLARRPVDRVLVDARCLQSHADRGGEEAARGRSELLRRDLHHARRRLGPAKRLTTVNGYDGGPFFSPDGKRIVWRRFDEQGLIADVWTMNLDGSDQRQVTGFTSMSWAPYIHPSGEYLLFASNKLGFENFEVFMVDVAGTKEPVRVTYSDGFDGLPVPVARWNAARVDVEPRRRPRRPDLPGAVESRGGAQGARAPARSPNSRRNDES